jgi:hypothetical protein
MFEAARWKEQLFVEFPRKRIYVCKTKQLCVLTQRNYVF